MFSLQRWLGKPDEFFGLLESSAQLSCEAVRALNETVAHPATPPELATFASVRRKDKEIINRLEEMLGLVFVTPIDREDLEDLAQGLYRIPKMVEKFAERYVITWDKIKEIDFSVACGMLELAAEVVRDMVTCLRNARPLTDIKLLEARLSQVEADASRVILGSLRRLYLPGVPSLEAIIAKELFDILAEGIDDCRDVGRILTLVVMKNS